MESSRPVSTLKFLPFVAGITFFASGLLYCYYTPLWNPPDEIRHFFYCEYIAAHYNLPRYLPDRDNGLVGMAFHPPLYYLLASFICKTDNESIQNKIVINDEPGYIKLIHPQEELQFPYSGKAREAYLIRIISLVLSAITVQLIYLLGIEIWPSEKLLAFAGAFFVGNIPQFLYVSASISNEPLAATLSTAYLLSLIQYIKNSHSRLRPVLCGIVLGGCFLSKTFTIFYLPVTVGMLFVLRYWCGKKFNSGFLIILCVSIIVSGWWFLGNWIYSGDFLLSKPVEIMYPWLIRHDWPSLYDIYNIIRTTFISFFGYFGALQFSISKLYLSFYGALIFLGICGLVHLIMAGKIKKVLTLFQNQAFILLILSLFSATGFFAIINLGYNGMFLGRYLFPALAPFAILIFQGLASLLPIHCRTYAVITICFLLLLINLDTVFRVIKPAYTDPMIVKGTNQPLFCCPTVKIDHNTIIKQTFIASKNNLCAIRIMFSCPENQTEGDILFTLQATKQSEKPFFTMHYPLREIKDFRRCFFIFPPMKDSQGQQYEFSFSAPSVTEGNGAALWYEENPLNVSGKLYVNNLPVNGLLYYSTYYFTGKYPKTDWEGRRELVINDGLYIYIPELQLYYEQSKEQREKSITHKKIQLCEQAIKERDRRGL